MDQSDGFISAGLQRFEKTTGGPGGAFIDDERRREMEQQQELKEALVAAHTANEAKSAFLSQMSHDIRTPMNVDHRNDDYRQAEY